MNRIDSSCTLSMEQDFFCLATWHFPPSGVRFLRAIRTIAQPERLKASGRILTGFALSLVRLLKILARDLFFTRSLPRDPETMLVLVFSVVHFRVILKRGLFFSCSLGEESEWTDTCSHFLNLSRVWNAPCYGCNCKWNVEIEMVPYETQQKKLNPIGFGRNIRFFTTSSTVFTTSNTWSNEKTVFWFVLLEFYMSSVGHSYFYCLNRGNRFQVPYLRRSLLEAIGNESWVHFIGYFQCI